MSELNTKADGLALGILPIDCWKYIFNDLDEGGEDGLKAVSLVCKDLLTISNFCKYSLQVVHPDVEMLSRHLRRFTQLKKIDLRRFKGDLEEAILEIDSSKILPNLEALSLGSKDSSQSAINLENSISHAKSLNSLTFSDMDVSDMLLSAISKANLPLRKFRLKYCRKFTVEGLLRVLSNYQLTKLCILGDGLKNRGDSAMKLVLSGDVGSLTHINICCCLLTSSTLFLLSTMCPLLTEIRMPYASFADFYAHDDDQDIPLSKNHKVQNICLRLSEVGDEWVKQLALLFPNIRILDLSGCHRLTCTGIEAILKNCKFITKLILVGYGEAKLVKDNSEFPEVINLEDLDISRSLIDDEGLSAIAEKCFLLVSLNLRWCDMVTMEGLKNIVKKVTTLKCIHISRPYDHTVDDLLEWMLCIANFASLKKIYVGGVDITEKYKEKFLRRV